MQGKKRAVLTDRDMSEKEYKYTAYIVVGVIFVIIGIAFSVSLRNLWEPNSDTRLILFILTALFLSGAFGGIKGFIDRMLRNFNQMGENKNIKEEKFGVTKRSVYLDEDIEDI